MKKWYNKVVPKMQRKECEKEFTSAGNAKGYRKRRCGSGTAMTKRYTKAAVIAEAVFPKGLNAVIIAGRSFF